MYLEKSRLPKLPAALQISFPLYSHHSFPLAVVKGGSRSSPTHPRRSASGGWRSRQDEPSLGCFFAEKYPEVFPEASHLGRVEDGGGDRAATSGGTLRLRLLLLFSVEQRQVSTTWDEQSIADLRVGNFRWVRANKIKVEILPGF